MPIYRWLNREDGRIVEVFRGLDDYLVPPEEVGDWVKLVDAPAGVMSPEGGNNRFADLKAHRSVERARKLAEAKGDLKEAKKLKQEQKKIGGKT